MMDLLELTAATNTFITVQEETHGIIKNDFVMCVM